MENEDQPVDPFADFINASLDLAGIDGLDQAAIAEKVRLILRGLPANVTSDLWNEQLDSLQAVIRVCLDLQTIAGAFEERIDSSNFSREDLEILIMLSVTFAFVSYNQLKPAYNVDEGRDSADALLARRLRDTLQVTSGWVKRAAREGDPIAGKLVGEIHSLLDASSHLE
ncbi:MAG: hypothetical protein GC204_14690 [Chloroflexi bacterium]|nr:hypothetical protein [Chloroflexota bacterium]